MVLTESCLGLEILVLRNKIIVLGMRRAFRVILVQGIFQLLIALIVKLLMRNRRLIIINRAELLLILQYQRR